VSGDGRRVLRVPRWTLAAILGTTGALLAVIAGSWSFVADYLTLRHQRLNDAAVHVHAVEQQALIDLYEKRIRQLSTEISGWRELHNKILEPFGPDVGLSKRTAGIGGGTAARLLTDRPDPRGGAGTEELSRLTRMVEEEGENLRALEYFLARAGKLLASLPSRWPLNGPVNSEFGSRLSPWAPSAEFHEGIDIGAPVGTPVRAPAPGTVVFVGRQAEYGITVIIEHGHETTSIYGHLSRASVAVNQRVERGDLIAWSGSTGRSSGPHLHYEIQVKGQPVNPHTYIWE